MQPMKHTGFLIVLLLLSGCTPKPLPEPSQKPVSELPGYTAFQAGESMFDNSQYDRALDYYNQYLRVAYDENLVDAALMKIGIIYRTTGRNDDAMGVFLRLIQEFPQSALIPEATLEVLRILYANDQFEAVIEHGRAYTEATDPVVQQLPFYVIIADAFGELDANLDAAQYYYRAWNTASETESEMVLTRLKHTIDQLSANEIQQLITQVTDSRAMGLLLYRLGMALIIDENYDDALDVLTAFVERFPEHPDYLDASDMIRTLVERARFTPFTIGCVLPLSGSYAIYGRRALNGIEMALSHSSEMGDGIPFKVTVKDSRSDPGGSINAVDELDSERVGAILGPMSASEVAAKRAQVNGIPIFVFTQKEGVTDIGSYVFRNFITPRMQVNSLVSYAVDELGARRFAILYPDENYGGRYMNLFWDQVIAYGAVVTGVETYDPDGTDFAKPIKKMTGIFYDIPRDLKEKSVPRIQTSLIDHMVSSVMADRELIDDPVELISGIPLDREAIESLDRRNQNRADQWHPIVDFDAVFIPDAPKKAGLIIPQLVYYDISDVYLLGTNLWNSKTLLKMSGEYMKETLIADGFFAESQSESVKRFVTDFKRTYSTVPGIIEAMAYDSAMMLFQTMRQTATDSRRDLKQALLQITDFNGVSGRTSFMENGEADRSLVMLRIERGRFVRAQRTPDPELAIEPR